MIRNILKSAEKAYTAHKLFTKKILKNKNFHFLDLYAHVVESIKTTPT